MKKKLFLIAALAVAAAVAAWYVLRMDQGDGMAYLTEPVTIGNITRTVNATGEVGAVQLVSVGAQVGGKFARIEPQHQPQLLRRRVGVFVIKRRHHLSQ